MKTATGVLWYDPRVVIDGREHFDPWWVVLACPPEILEEARARAAADGLRLSRPRWGSHVSVVSGEEPPARDRWGHRDGELVTFSYDETAQTDGLFYWLRVECADALDVRAALGLARDPRAPLHLTLGRRKG